MQNLEQKRYSLETRAFLPSNMQLRFFGYENSKKLRVVGRKRYTFKWSIPRNCTNNYRSFFDLLSLLTPKKLTIIDNHNSISKKRIINLIFPQIQFPPLSNRSSTSILEYNFSSRIVHTFPTYDSLSFSSSLSLQPQQRNRGSPQKRSTQKRISWPSWR